MRNLRTALLLCGVVAASAACTKPATDAAKPATPAAATAPAVATVNGKDISALMRGEPGATSPHDAFFYYMCDQLDAVRSGQWKLQLRRGKLAVRGARPAADRAARDRDVA